jgi:hypothetical protein
VGLQFGGFEVLGEPRMVFVVEFHGPCPHSDETDRRAAQAADAADRLSPALTGTSGDWEPDRITSPALRRCPGGPGCWPARPPR